MTEKDARDPIVEIVLGYRTQAAQARLSRMDQNAQNLDCFHLKQDWSHKVAGQSKEFLAKQQTATEQFVSFLQQGLMDTGNWFSVIKSPGVVESKIEARDIQILVKRQLEKVDFYTIHSDALKTGVLQSLMVVKVHGKMVPKVKYRTERVFSLSGIKKKLLRDEKMVWQAQIDLVRPQDYYPDPTGKKLYEVQDIEMDLHELIEIARQNPNDYDQEAVEALQAGYDSEQRAHQSRETNQDLTSSESGRKMVKVTECWGTFLDPHDSSVLHENSVCAIANDTYLIRKPKPNQFWHGESPFVAAPIVRVPFSVWHRALADAGTKHNLAQNEIYNLMLDSGMQAVWGLRQIREHWLDDPSQIANGIPWGTTLRVNAACPPLGKVMERVDTANQFSEAVNVYNITDRELQSAMMTNDTRMGMMAERNVKATELVSANQAITGIMNGIVTAIETPFTAKIIRLLWITAAQHLDDYDDAEVKALLGDEKAKILSSMAPEDVFAETANGMRFHVFGMSTTLNKINDFKKYTMLLQTIAASPDLMSAFSQKNDMGKMLDEMISSLDIDLKKIQRDDVRPETIQGPAPMPTLEAIANGGQPQQPGQGANNGGGKQTQAGVAAGAGGPGTRNLQNIPNPRGVGTGIGIPRSELLQGMTTPGQ